MTRLRRWSRRLAGLYLGYMAVVVLVLMPLANLFLPDLVRQQTGRTLQFDLLTLNPLTLSAELRNAVMDNPDGSDFLRLRNLVVNPSLLRSLWSRHPVLDELILRDLELHVHRNAGGTFNFDDILAHRQQLAEPSTKPPTKPSTTANDQQKDQERDQQVPSREQHPSEESAGLPPVSIDLMVFSARELGYREQRGQEEFVTSIEDLAFELSNFTTVHASGRPYRLAADSGTGGNLYWEGELSVPGAFSQGRLRLRDLNLLPAHEYFEPRLNFTADGARLDVDLHYRVDWQDGVRLRLDDSAATLSGVNLGARDDADTGVRLHRLHLDGIALDSGQRQAQARALTVKGLAVRGHSDGGDISLTRMFTPPATSGSPPEEPGEPWRLTLEQAALEDSDIHWHAAELAPALHIRPDLELQNLHWPATQPAQLQAQLHINERSHLTLQGQLHADGSRAELKGELSELPLAWANPVLKQVLAARIHSGTLATHWQLRLVDGGLNRIEMERGGITDLHLDTGIEPPDEPLLAWNALNWREVAIDLRNRAASIRALDWEQPRGRLAITADGSTNIHPLLRTDDGDQPESDAAGPSWSLAIAAIAVKEGELDFSDASLALPFRTRIRDFGGTIEALDSSAGTPARVDLEGQVDGYAPVALLGTVRPMARPPALDLQFTFRGLDLSTLTPYSGTYAGYTVDKGLLTVDLGYALENNRIRGDNRIVVDQLQLGDSVASERALDLPLKLAIALLTDSDGVMDLNVPVEGDLDDPQFDLGGIIWTAFRNLLTKAVSAPFSLLASLVDSEQPLDHVDFRPGSSSWADSAPAVLEDLVQALEQRPRLRVGLRGQVGPTDGDALAEEHLERILNEGGLTPEQLQARGEQWQQALADLYRKRLPEGTAENADTMHRQLLEALQPSPQQLQNLAAERAVKAKQALVERGLAAERIFLQRGEDVRGEHPSVKLDVDT